MAGKQKGNSKFSLLDLFKKESDKKISKKDQIEKEIALLQLEFEKQDEFLKERSKVLEIYKTTGDASACLDFYRRVFESEDNLKSSGSWVFDYPEILIKEKMYNEAWAALNKLHIFAYQKKGRIYSLQYQVLKEEKRNPADAIYFLMASYLYKVEGSQNPISFFVEYEKPIFLKKAKPLAKKVGFGDQELEYLSFLIETEIKSNRYSDSNLRKAYSKFLKEFKSN